MITNSYLSAKSARYILSLFLFLFTGITSAQITLINMLPEKKDFTEMWWKEGMPAKVPNAPWHRCILGGNFAMVLDTEKIQIPHMGDAEPRSSVAQINALPAADLKLSISLNGKTYTCVGATPFSRNTGPRIIESGHFFQRADVTDLIFQSSDGEKLDTAARFETSAWSDRLSFLLYAEPGKDSDGKWSNASMSIELSNASGSLKKTSPSSTSGKGKVSLVFEPITMKELLADQKVTVSAQNKKDSKTLPVTYDHELGWHEVNLSAASSFAPPKSTTTNDNITSVLLTLSNPTDTDQSTPLAFVKNKANSITGITAMIRDLNGAPTGIPIQLSKNWHTQHKTTHSGNWFRGISKITIPAKSTIKLELVIINAHWGGVAAASHAQLSLIGWGSNQLWEQSALGAWGESICYEPDQAQASCFITDVRPLMVKTKPSDRSWRWTGNVGGGDYLKLFDPSGERIHHSSVRTLRHRQGPCLTDVTYEGNIDQKIEHSIATSISRTDDIVRGTYRIKMKVNKAIPFSRFAIFQIGADTYNMSPEKKMAAGDMTTGLINEWETKNAKGAYINPAVEYTGKTPWFSLHEAEDTGKDKILANRGLVIRSWKARLGGNDASPWVGEYGVFHQGKNFSILDITPPAGVSELLPGDYVDAVIEYIVMPKKVEHYYGPNTQLKDALKKAANTWKMIFREAKYNSHQVNVLTGALQHRFPDVRIKAVQNKAQLKFKGGLGYVPFTFTGLTDYRGYRLQVDGKTLDQSVHGNDFWQTDFDIKTKTWSITYNVATPEQKIYNIALIPSK